MQISKNKNMCIFLMSQVSLNSKIRFLSQKVCPVARSQTDRHTDRVTTEGTLSGFHDFFLQPIIKDRPKMHFFLMFQGSFKQITLRHRSFNALEDIFFNQSNLSCFKNGSGSQCPFYPIYFLCSELCCHHCRNRSR